MAAAKQSCRTCALWDIRAAMDSAGRVIQRGARCLWRSTEPWPASVSKFDRRPEPHFMCKDQGYECPCYKPRDPDRSKF